MKLSRASLLSSLERLRSKIEDSLPGNDPNAWPYNSAAAYCRHLAQIILLSPIQTNEVLAQLPAHERELIATKDLASSQFQLKTNLADPPNTQSLLRKVLRFGSLSSAATSPADLDRDRLAWALYRSPQTQARLAVITEYTTSKWLLEQELKARGEWCPTNQNPYPDAYAVASEINTAGICLSGGGIRSATFALGVLQGLARNKMLHRFHYLSSVSGGGYIHQFLAAWIHRKDVATVQETLDDIPQPVASQSRRTVQSEPLRWLRRYSNYLAPQKGLFSADTWTLFAIITRNAGLNLLTLVSSLLTALFLPHLVVSDGFLDWVRTHRSVPFFLNVTGHTSALIGILLSVAIGTIGIGRCFWPTADFAEEEESNNRGFKTFSSMAILFGGLLPIVFAVILATPSAYLSIFPTQPYSVSNAPELFSYNREKLTTVHQERSSIDGTFHLRSVTYPPVTDGQRLHSQWAQRPPYPTFHPLEMFSFWRIGNQVALDYLFVLITSFGLVLAVSLSIPGVPAFRKKLILTLLVLFVLLGVPQLALLLLYCQHLFMFCILFFVPPALILSVAAVLTPLLLLGIPCIVLEISMGIIGNAMEDSQREWLSRLRAFTFLWGIVWLGLGGFSLLGPALVAWLGKMVIAKYTVLGTWVFTTIGGVIAGQSRKTDGKSSDKSSPKTASLELLASIAPPVFVAGLLLLLSALAQLILPLVPSCHWLPPLAIALLVSATIAALFGWRVDINDFSMQPFYRDRIARCYAAASDPDRNADKFSGFSGDDRRLRVSDLLPVSFATADDSLWKLTGKKPNQYRQPPTYQGPFPIFCTAINLTVGQDLAYQERKAASFAFTPLYSGYSVGTTASQGVEQQFNGFVPTVDYAYSTSGGVAMATAVATSGAAASPNSGYHTSPAVAFLLTMFNVRLGWWIKNPRTKKPRTWSSPVFGLLQLLNELRGAADDASRYVYLSDGGHFENMGLYELVRRRCRTIVICDGEMDCDLKFDGLAHAIRKARLDFGVQIDLKDVRYMTNDGTNPGHVVKGTITYPEDPEHPGIVVYLKTSLDGDEPADIMSYKREDPAFPQDSTLDQFFTESKFESYRALGMHIVSRPSVIAHIDWALKRNHPFIPLP